MIEKLKVQEVPLNAVSRIDGVYVPVDMPKCRIIVHGNLLIYIDKRGNIYNLSRDYTFKVIKVNEKITLTFNDIG